MPRNVRLQSKRFHGEHGAKMVSNVMQASTIQSEPNVTKGFIMLNQWSQRSRFCPRRAVAVTAAVLSVSFAGAAVAQPAGDHGGPHAGMMGQGGGDGMLGHLIAHAQSSLNLNTSQKLAFDAAVAQTNAARETGRALHQKVKDAIAAELAKPEPDLAAVAGVADGVQQQGTALRHQVRDAWLQLYATFTPEQKGVVRDLMQKRMAHAESFRQKMMQHLQGG
jgi:Spy/CpxP family protein refolding chaperone